MNTFYHLLTNALLAATKNNFVWFALTFWSYLETQSVIATSLVGGSFLVVNAVSAFWLGSIVDHHRKKYVLLASNLATLLFYLAATLVFFFAPAGAFQSISSWYLWLFGALLLLGVVAGSTYNIAIPTLVTILVPPKDHDRANGMFGTVMGVSFALTSVASGLVLGLGGMSWVLSGAIAVTILSIMHLLFISIPEKKIATSGEDHTGGKLDLAGTIRVIQQAPGLFALIFLTTFNNLLGGVFMALMDAYGLTLVSVQVWGLLWGGLSFSFIFGGLYISKYGIGTKPIRSLFRVYLVLWTSTIFFAIQPSIVLLAIGAAIWMSLSPFIEATEQTIIQKVVPKKRQGRVFGFAHSIEQAASPFTAFLIGPIAEGVFIPFMTTGSGVGLIGYWFGVGPGRGIALVFIMAGLVGLVVTLITMRAKTYKQLALKISQP